MPNNDRSGPFGEGPRTGKQQGLCGKRNKENKNQQEETHMKGHQHRCQHGKGNKWPEGFKILYMEPK